MKKTFKIFFAIIFIIAAVSSSNAQTPKSIVNKKDILIGEKINLTIVAEKSNAVIIPDSIPHFEIITKDSRDTIINATTFVKTDITFTSFDSGAFYFPALQNKKNANASDSFMVNVGYMPIDKEAVPRDIKTIIEEDYTDWTLIKWIAIALLALAVLFFIIRKLVKKKKIVEQTINKNAYKDAILALQNLNNQNEENKISIKDLHTELATVLKTYYSAVDNTNVLAKTSNEVLSKLAAFKLQTEIAIQTKTALQTGDATKFAKYEPQIEENKNAIVFIKNTIDGIENIQEQKNKN
jgi:hypothetical protein